MKFNDISVEDAFSNPINGSTGVNMGESTIIWFCEIIVFDVNPSLSCPIISKTYDPNSKLSIFINVSPLAP